MAKDLYYKTEEEIELMRDSSLLVGKVHAEMAKLVEPGVTTKQLDEVAEAFIRDHGAVPSFKGYRGFPYALCVSRNSEVVHGMPSNKPLEEGDIVSIDCGVFKNGFHGDSAYTFAVGKISNDVKQLMKVTYEALYLGIEQAAAGNRVGDISNAIQQHAENHGYGVVRELVGHGVGKKLHEAPEVPNFGKRGRGPKLGEGLVIAIEPMINMGTKNVRQASDGWTIHTADSQPSAHYEHTVVIRKGKAEILSTFEYIEKVLKEKNNDKVLA
ncbi:MAG: type I methionyl aminopeptidase [Flavobacteriales bacterium]|nr:MAG: type I methionyl aminopeptidase [Flavobacteriales bacterium]